MSEELVGSYKSGVGCWSFDAFSAGGGTGDGDGRWRRHWRVGVSACWRLAASEAIVPGARLSVAADAGDAPSLINALIT